jgi:SNF2 family DNA or RNA helicase
MRCHRIGQNAKLVRVRKFVVKHSVEERIIALQERKKNVAAKILNNDDNATELEDANKATLDDFKLLFGV